VIGAEINMEVKGSVTAPAYQADDRVVYCRGKPPVQTRNRFRTVITHGKEIEMVLPLCKGFLSKNNMSVFPLCRSILNNTVTPPCKVNETDSRNDSRCSVAKSIVQYKVTALYTHNTVKAYPKHIEINMDVKGSVKSPVSQVDDRVGHCRGKPPVLTGYDLNRKVKGSGKALPSHVNAMVEYCNNKWKVTWLCTNYNKWFYGAKQCLSVNYLLGNKGMHSYNGNMMKGKKGGKTKG